MRFIEQQQQTKHRGSMVILALLDRTVLSNESS